MIIWAGQRTGSSTFINWLYQCDLKEKRIDKYNLKYITPIPFNNLEVFNIIHGAYRNNNNLEQILNQDFVMKIHPEFCTDEFIFDIIKYSKNHRHIILYREDPYARLLSLHYAQINDEYYGSKKGKATYRTDRVNVERLIDQEKVLRQKYQYLLNLMDGECISYEKLYIEKDKQILKEMFPTYNHNVLLTKQRYPVSKRYHEILGKGELEAECLKLGKFYL